MPLLDHFHPPLHGPRRWEGFHHSWAAMIAQQLNEVLPPDYFAESEISLGPELEIDVAAMEGTKVGGTVATAERSTKVWSPPRPRFAVKADYSRLDTIEVRISQDLGGAELRAAVELVSPGNKDRSGSRQTFAAKCAGYLKHGISWLSWMSSLRGPPTCTVNYSKYWKSKAGTRSGNRLQAYMPWPIAR